MTAIWWDVTRRYHEYSAAVGVFEDPIYAWAGGGYVAASSFQFYEHDESRGFVGGCHIACAGVGIPLPINWSVPGRPAWGAEAKQIDRDFFNHSFAIGMVLHDLPQHESRVELDDKVRDAWGLPVARITNKIHENDLKMGRWVIDHNAEILRGGRSEKDLPRLSATDYRQLFSPARHHANGKRSQNFGA